MSLEWEKIESKPEKPYKVEGQFLLDQRAKIAGSKVAVNESPYGLVWRFTSLRAQWSQGEGRAEVGKRSKHHHTYNQRTSPV